jgi:hypothetical protein
MKRPIPRTNRLDRLEQLIAGQDASPIDNGSFSSPMLFEANSANREEGASQLLHYRLSIRANVGNGNIRSPEERS